MWRGKPGAGCAPLPAGMGPARGARPRRSPWACREHAATPAPGGAAVRRGALPGRDGEKAWCLSLRPESALVSPCAGPAVLPVAPAAPGAAVPGEAAPVSRVLCFPLAWGYAVHRGCEARAGSSGASGCARPAREVSLCWSLGGERRCLPVPLVLRGFDTHTVI